MTDHIEKNRPKAESRLTLALETSSRWGSMVLGKGGPILAEQGFSGPLRHSVELLPTLKSMLQEIQASPQDIGRIALSIGPGSFTGLRIAVAMAKSVALTNHVEVVTVSSLDVVAANAFSPPTPEARLIAPVLDAKRGQFFMAAYHQRPTTNGSPEKILEDCLVTPAEFHDRCQAWNLPIYFLGEGLVYHQDRFLGDNQYILDESLWSPKAEQVYHLAEQKAQAGQFEDPLTLTPHYLREALVTPKGKK